MQSNLEARLFEGTGPACIIAEAGSNHNGDIAKAKAEHLKVVRPGEKSHRTGCRLCLERKRRWKKTAS